jgi:2-aminoadipate transaminase
VNYERFYVQNVREALRYRAPGEWIPEVQKNSICLHAGYPAPELVPSDELCSVVQSLLNREQDLPFQYSGSPQAANLKSYVVTRMGQRWKDTGGNSTLLTSGSAQAIDLIARVFLDRTTGIVVEAPTYMEALETFTNYTDVIISIPVDREGLCTDLLEETLNERQQKGLPLPRLLYTVASFHNPTGMTMSLERRIRLLELANTFGFVVIEDDAYGELSFGESPMPLKALDHTGQVIYVGSLSKIVAPGLRIGWMTGATEVIETIARFKKDLGHPFAEAVVAEFLQGLNWPMHLSKLRKTYRMRRDVLLQALRTYMPDHVTWIPPAGGFFIWLSVHGRDTTELLPLALRKGVSFVSGVHFYHERHRGAQNLRLSYSYVDPDRMVEGVRILANVIKGG